jgi:hypothetical protein
MSAISEVSPVSSATPSDQRLAGAPSLDNQMASEWEVHRELAYIFARHVRHDMVNVQCSLQLIEVVEKMREMGGDVALPPELQPDQVKIKVRQALKQIAAMCNDLVLLSQAANPAAYRHPHVLTGRELLETAVSARLTDTVLPADFVASPAAEARMVSMGDMLQAAVAACCFQWTPWLQATANPIGRLSASAHSVEVSFPIIDPALAGFARKLMVCAKADAAGRGRCAPDPSGSSDHAHQRISPLDGTIRHLAAWRPVGRRHRAGWDLFATESSAGHLRARSPGRRPGVRRCCSRPTGRRLGRDGLFHRLPNRR